MAAESLLRDALATVGIAINGAEPWDLRVLEPRAYERILRDGTVGFGEAFMDGWLDCDRMDQFADRVYRGKLAVRLETATAFFEALKARLSPFGSRSRSFEIGKNHYDVGNDLFEVMLDPYMIYSCAYWLRAQSLDEAQADKLELICRKLQLEPGMRLLDIGCGFGGLARYAAERRGVHVVGITVSARQMELGKRLCAGLPVEFRLADYRDLDESFDRVVSVGMFEHVGLSHYGEFFKQLYSLLADDGVAVVHTIAMKNDPGPFNPWMQRYIFPGAYLPTLSELAPIIEKQDFWMTDLENWRLHYAMTLAAWNERFQARRPVAVGRSAGSEQRGRIPLGLDARRSGAGGSDGIGGGGRALGLDARRRRAGPCRGRRRSAVREPRERSGA